MMTLDDVKAWLKNYDGPSMRIMEVCGSHTGAISKNGIPGMLSEKISLLSGPGCPVCVTPSAYIDRLIELAMRPDTCVVTFGDLIRVPGSSKSLALAKGEGARVKMVYSPLDIIPLAKKDPDTIWCFAAVGFETTTPVYAALMDELIRDDIRNVRLLTALKTMPEVIDWLMSSGADVQGFIAPGHVSVVTGADIWKPLAQKYSIPFGVAGFEGPELLAAIAGIVMNYGRGVVKNYYPRVVTPEGNRTAQKEIDRYFEKADVVWRGMGKIPGSGRVLRPEYSFFDAGSRGLDEDHKKNKACHCDEVLTGRITPRQCPLFGKACTPVNPQGACMVSTEGACLSWLAGGRE
ncbi:MAG: hydrogenase formation protein HypD [Lachnospiraceae bacterium]|jgi:hydrogenase expression/formation protein HypD|nr:hydrogenase formation protein HypD [Lachnospiraceae bacterium]MCH4108454.1 hydrogenase formation protein HypD [Lachnospiraceae bacterium]MCI1302531.1 hydrogenase formation protein HypD [Lachnospiraceae bacterium]MCI1331704.1 hydrogenase formation protein HypD [Lachnospiraceae bacterium]MCI1360962.1 hydrogenase formation protein HypD [Lachnospiraceae bacterium]